MCDWMRWLVPMALGLASAVPSLAQEGVYRRAIKTSDGVSIALYRYAPNSTPPDRPAVLLVSDVGFNAQVFDWGDRGLARFLASRGIEVFSFDWRGTGLSQVPTGFGLADLAERDLPAALGAVGAAHVVLVGWGIGASLALAQACHDPERIAGVVALSAPLDLDVPNVIARKWLGSLPTHGLTTLPGFPGDPPDDPALFNLLYAHGNALPPSEVLRIRREATGRIGAGVAADLGRWMRAGDVTLYGRGLHEICRGFDRPVLLVLAPLDNWTHPEFAEPWVDILPRTSVEPLSWVDGYGEDYGHLGPLFGKDARRAWKRIAAFASKPEVSK